MLSGLIWVQTVCKDCQQTALVGKEFVMFQAQLRSGFIFYKNLDGRTQLFLLFSIKYLERFISEVQYAKSMPFS